MSQLHHTYNSVVLIRSVGSFYSRLCGWALLAFNSSVLLASSLFFSSITFSSSAQQKQPFCNLYVLYSSQLDTNHTSLCRCFSVTKLHSNYFIKYFFHHFIIAVFCGNSNNMEIQYLRNGIYFKSSNDGIYRHIGKIKLFSDNDTHTHTDLLSCFQIQRLEIVCLAPSVAELK